MKSKFTWILTLLMALTMNVTFAQEKTLTGTVSDANGPLPGVTVTVKGGDRVTQTDFDGNYTIKAKTGEVLEFSYLGMKTASQTVGASSVLNFTMQVDSDTLTEVVVVGFSTKSRAELTSAVSTVTAEQLKRSMASTSIDNMLQGQAAGVQVVSQNGKPGATAFVRIRGIGSIQAGNEPLYIVDGAQISEADLNGINPNDVESMSVLKDAASTSIYGARGGNGVVLITTKRGSKDRDAVFTLSTRVATTRKIKDNFDMMNAGQMLQYQREIGVGLGSTVSSQAQYDRLVGFDHDWQDDLLEDGFIKSTSLSVSGGDSKTRYFLSLGYDEDSGIVKNMKEYNRVSGRLNVDYDAKSWATIGTSLSFSSLFQGDGRDRNNAQNVFRAMYDYLPYETLYQLDDNDNVVTDLAGNPVYNVTSQGFSVSEGQETNPIRRYYNRFLGNIYLDLKLTDNLSFRTQGSGVYEQYRRENLLKPGSNLDLIVNADVPTGSKTDNGSFDFTYNYLNRASYKNTFNEVHNLEVTALTEYIFNNNRSYLATGTGFNIGPLTQLDVATLPNAVGGTRSQYSIFSMAGSVDYNYKSKYIATASIRRDGSSRFGPSNKFGTFWSGSLAWNAAEEDFLKGGIFDVLKLRASAGTSGNDQIGRYTWQTTYSYPGYNGEIASTPDNFGDKGLTWEKNFNLGVGIEFTMFNNRLRGVVDVYKKTTDDLLLGTLTPVTTGYRTVVSNVGEMVNKGLEIELSGDIVKNQDFTLTLGGNINFYDNEITRLNPQDGNADVLTAANSYTIQRVGEEVNSFYLTRYAGVNPANGDALYYDTDGNITNTPGGNEVVLSGKSPFADLDGSVNLYANYKGFDISANMYYKVGNYIFNLVEYNMLSDGDNAINSNQRLDAFNYWRNPGDTNVLPRPNNNSNQISDRFLQEGSYLRLRNVQLGYNVPKSFLDRTALQSLRFYVAATNLWTYAPYYKGDPEIGIGSAESQTGGVIPGEFSLYSYPTTRNISFGVDVKF